MKSVLRKLIIPLIGLIVLLIGSTTLLADVSYDEFNIWLQRNGGHYHDDQTYISGFNMGLAVGGSYGPSGGSSIGYHTIGFRLYFADGSGQRSSEFIDFYSEKNKGDMRYALDGYGDNDGQTLSVYTYEQIEITARSKYGEKYKGYFENGYTVYIDQIMTRKENGRDVGSISISNGTSSGTGEVAYDWEKTT